MLFVRRLRQSISRRKEGRSTGDTRRGKFGFFGLGRRVAKKVVEPEASVAAQTSHKGVRIYDKGYDTELSQQKVETDYDVVAAASFQVEVATVKPLLVKSDKIEGTTPPKKRKGLFSKSKAFITRLTSGKVRAAPPQVMSDVVVASAIEPDIVQSFYLGYTLSQMLESKDDSLKLGVVNDDEKPSNQVIEAMREAFRKVDGKTTRQDGATRPVDVSSFEKGYIRGIRERAKDGKNFQSEGTLTKEGCLHKEYTGLCAAPGILENESQQKGTASETALTRVKNQEQQIASSARRKTEVSAWTEMSGNSDDTSAAPSESSQSFTAITPITKRNKALSVGNCFVCTDRGHITHDMADSFGAFVQAVFGSPGRLLGSEEQHGRTKATTQTPAPVSILCAAPTGRSVRWADNLMCSAPCGAEENVDEPYYDESEVTAIPVLLKKGSSESGLRRANPWGDKGTVESSRANGEHDSKGTIESSRMSAEHDSVREYLEANEESSSSLSKQLALRKASNLTYVSTGLTGADERRINSKRQAIADDSIKFVNFASGESESATGDIESEILITKELEISNLITTMRRNRHNYLIQRTDAALMDNVEAEDDETLSIPHAKATSTQESSKLLQDVHQTGTVSDEDTSLQDAQKGIIVIREADGIDNSTVGSSIVPLGSRSNCRSAFRDLIAVSTCDARGFMFTESDLSEAIKELEIMSGYKAEEILAFANNLKLTQEHLRIQEAPSTHKSSELDQVSAIRSSPAREVDTKSSTGKSETGSLKTTDSGISNLAASFNRLRFKNRKKDRDVVSVGHVGPQADNVQLIESTFDRNEPSEEHNSAGQSESVYDTRDVDGIKTEPVGTHEQNVVENGVVGQLDEQQRGIPKEDQNESLKEASRTGSLQLPDGDQRLTAFDKFDDHPKSESLVAASKSEMRDDDSGHKLEDDKSQSGHSHITTKSYFSRLMKATGFGAPSSDKEQIGVSPTIAFTAEKDDGDRSGGTNVSVHSAGAQSVEKSKDSRQSQTTKLSFVSRLTAGTGLGSKRRETQEIVTSSPVVIPEVSADVGQTQVTQSHRSNSSSRPRSPVSRLTADTSVRSTTKGTNESITPVFVSKTSVDDGRSHATRSHTSKLSNTFRSVGTDKATLNTSKGNAEASSIITDSNGDLTLINDETTRELAALLLQHLVRAKTLSSAEMSALKSKLATSAAPSVQSTISSGDQESSARGTASLVSALMEKFNFIPNSSKAQSTIEKIAVYSSDTDQTSNVRSRSSRSFKRSTTTPSDRDTSYDDTGSHPKEEDSYLAYPTLSALTDSFSHHTKKLFSDGSSVDEGNTSSSSSGSSESNYSSYLSQRSKSNASRSKPQALVKREKKEASVIGSMNKFFISL